MNFHSAESNKYDGHLVADCGVEQELCSELRWKVMECKYGRMR
jgi:hypothetical protein